MTATAAPPPVAAAATSGRGITRLGPILAWAVVFADLGTSVYYVPGILYGQVGAMAPAFVLIATVAFVLVAFEHLEIAHRFPGGGGGVSAAVAAFGPRVGVISGALMVSAYLLTIALSVVSALHYIAALRPWTREVTILSGLAIVGLGFVNWVGVRDVARFALVAALAALVVDAALLAAVVTQLRAEEWAELFGNIRHVGSVSWAGLATGFAGAWLAFSGLESLGQLAPAVREPRLRVIRAATVLVVISVVLTAPIFTALAVEAASAGGIAAQGALLAPVALKYGGNQLLVAVAITGAALLLLAANVAFIGCYNVFQAIGEHGYLPAAVARRHPGAGVPRGAVIVITAGALVLILIAQADLRALGQLFAFGLLGSYAITSISIDALRWREKRRGPVFWAGVLASLALVVPWVTSWVTKPIAAIYGAVTSGILLAVALVTHRGWIRAGRVGYFRASSAEEAAADLPGAIEVVTLAEAIALKASYPSTTLVALRSPNPALCREAARRARGVGDAAIYLIYVDEVPGLVFPPNTGPSEAASRCLRSAAAELRQEGMDAVPIWRLAHDAGESIAEAAEDLGVGCILVGTTQRSAVWHFLRGNVLKKLMTELPEPIHVVICE